MPLTLNMHEDEDVFGQGPGPIQLPPPTMATSIGQGVDRLPSRPISEFMSPGQPTGGGGLKGWAGRNSTLLKLLGGLGLVGGAAATGGGEGLAGLSQGFSNTFVDKLQKDQAAKRQTEYDRDKERRAAAHDIFSKYSDLDLSEIPDFQQAIQGYGKSLVDPKGGKYDPSELLAGAGQHGGRLSDMLLARDAKRAGQLETSKTKAQLDAQTAADTAGRTQDLGGGVMGTRADAVRQLLEKQQAESIAKRQGGQQMFDLNMFQKRQDFEKQATQEAAERARDLAIMQANIRSQLDAAQQNAQLGRTVAGAQSFMPGFNSSQFQMQPIEFSPFGTPFTSPSPAPSRSNSEVPGAGGKDPGRMIKFQGQLVPFSSLPKELQAKVLELGG